MKSPSRAEGLEERVEAGLRDAGVIEGTPPIASLHVEEIHYAYPVPTRERDAALAEIQPWLMQRGIFSRVASVPGATRSATWTTR